MSLIDEVFDAITDALGYCPQVAEVGPEEDGFVPVVIDELAVVVFRDHEGVSYRVAIESVR